MERWENALWYAQTLEHSPAAKGNAATPNVSGHFSHTGPRERFRSPDQTQHGPLAETRRSRRNTGSCKRRMAMTWARREANMMPGSSRAEVREGTRGRCSSPRIGGRAREALSCY